MKAFDIFWDIRRLPLIVTIYDTVPVVYSQMSSEVQAGPSNFPDHSVVGHLADGAHEVEADTTATEHGPDGEQGSGRKVRKGRDLEDDEEPWVDDEEEYVGLNDEAPYMSDVEGEIAFEVELPHMSHADVDVDIAAESSDDSVVDELVVDDSVGCETVEHVTNLENPSIAVGVTFEDGDIFRRAIRQYAVLNEFEIAAPYSEKQKYRGHCKGKQRTGKNCKWRIHASLLQDGMTWQIKKLQPKHTCASTSKLKHNSMATNAWVRDRVIDVLREEPTTGAAFLKKELEKKYNIQLSYYVVWDGRKMALEQIEGKWDDSFDHAYSFKAEVERTNPGSLVEIEYAQVGKKVRFTKMFVALKTCVDGFLNGCRPFLGVDSTVLTGRWRGQLASASAVDGHNWLNPTIPDWMLH
ncbi:unnamed protein product [Urochloa humidicola]